MTKEINTASNKLKELHSSGFEMRDGEPDIRGWKVKTSNSQEVGKVRELLFDTVSLRVRYLVMALDGKPLNLLSRDVIVPVGLVNVAQADKIVSLPAVTVGHFASLPEYKKGKVTMETERTVRKVFAHRRSFL